MKTVILLLLLSQLTLTARSCECGLKYDRTGFCSVVHIAQSRPGFCIVSVRVTSWYHWGMNVQVLDNIYNTPLADTMLVWGDNGASCRPALTGSAGFNIGDTLILALEHTDLMGNILAPSLPDYEDTAHYMLPGCGTYYMRYHNDKIVGYMDDNETADTIDYAIFKTLVQSCVSGSAGVGTGTATSAGIIVSPNPASSEIHVSSNTAIEQYVLTNTMGRTLTKATTDSSKTFSIDIAGLPPGLYLLSLYGNNRTRLSVHKVLKR